MKKVLTVKNYIEKRASQSYGKTIRILDAKTHASRGSWFNNQEAIVKEVKITSRVLFIFI